MIPLIILLSVFILSTTIREFYKKESWFFPANLGMSVMLLFTAMGHFLFTNGMSLMIPPVIPFKTVIIYLTGGIEFMAAFGLLIPSLRSKTGCLLAVFFVLSLPANIYAAIQNLDYQKGTYDGNGLNYLWFRIPLQFFFIAWVYLSSIKFVSPRNTK